MKTKIELLRGWNGLSFSGFIAYEDFPRLNRFDRLVIEECEKSNNSSDWLLALEIIFRRMNELKTQISDEQGE